MFIPDDDVEEIISHLFFGSLMLQGTPRIEDLRQATEMMLLAEKLQRELTKRSLKLLPSDPK